MLFPKISIIFVIEDSQIHVIHSGMTLETSLFPEYSLNRDGLEWEA